MKLSHVLFVMLNLRVLMVYFCVNYVNYRRVQIAAKLSAINVIFIVRIVVNIIVNLFYIYLFILFIN